MRDTLFRRCWLAGAAVLVAAPWSADARMDYTGAVHVVPAEGTAAEAATGIVFEDLSRDGIYQEDEPGIAGVIVSNGRDVVETAADGTYTLPVFDDMTVMVSEPAGYDVPVNADGVPQFFYVHKPDGTPEELRYGGLEPTGPLPAAINFPLVRNDEGDQFSCVVMGDTQPYSNTEIGYVRDGVLDTLLDHAPADARCMLLLGDVMGDDLDLLPRFMNTMSVLGLPQYYIHGNHDFDFDATSDAHSADSWRRIYGPNYYSFEIGEVVFIALDNVIYPCGAEDDGPGDRSLCVDPTRERPTYNGRVTEQQMTWLENTLALVPEDKLVVFMHHIPFVSFIDSGTGRHQTDNIREIHALVQGRPALSLSGHTHTYEYLAAGEWYESWQEMVGITRLPFDHIIAGAPSGNWFQGDFGFDGTPLAFARDGTPPGYMVLEFDGNRFRTSFHAANQPTDRAMALSFNTPQFRSWFDTLWPWQDEMGRGADATPPVTVNDLDDRLLFTPEDLAAGVFLTANIWNGNRHTQVTAEFAGQRLQMTRTQEGNGEGVRSGADYADPFAAPRQMTIGRYAWQSASEDPRTQGFELFQGDTFGPVPPQGMRSTHIADSSTHLWRLQMPEDLPVGTHVATVTAIDRHGREFTDRIVFEVREERPARFWRHELWEES